jgi:hypothetical protein
MLFYITKNDHVYKVTCLKNDGATYSVIMFTIFMKVTDVSEFIREDRHANMTIPYSYLED